MAGAVVLLAVVGGDDDVGGPGVVEATGPVDAVAYAADVTRICSGGLAEAEQRGYEDAGAGADALDALAAELAALPAPEGQRQMAQALVDGIGDYAELFRDEAESDPEEFSQDQNELAVVLEVRAAGLGADCGEGEMVLFPSEPADPAEVADAAGDDPTIAAAADACHAGDLGACDDLIASGSSLVYYGVTCGGRLLHEEANENIGCVASFASDRPVGDQP